MNFIVMDFETANSSRDSAVSIALVFVRNNVIEGKYYSLIDPEVPFSKRNTMIHGIRQEDVLGKPVFPEIWEKIGPFFNEDTIFVAHNAPFDVSVLKATLERYDVEEPHFQILDTVKYSKAVLPDIENYRLNTLSELLQVELTNHHNALDDALATAKILIKETKLIGEETVMPFIKYV